MGDHAMICSVSGLGIDGGTAVRCLLLTASPYYLGTWLVRTPPIRATYNGYGTVENVHAEDAPIAALWLRGLREDLVRKGLGDNSVHDVPVRVDMTLPELFDAVRAGRVEVRRDTERFWRRPLLREHVPRSPSLAERVEQVLEIVMPGMVSKAADDHAYVVDEPVPNLVRVRYGRFQRGEEHRAALQRALEAVEKAAFAGVIAAGSGRYPDVADLFVFSQSSDNRDTRGPEWDMVNDTKPLRVAMAMVREDVWQALIAYPHADYVAIDCTNCWQAPYHHGHDRRCPDKQMGRNALKEHALGATYAHESVFPDGVEHKLEPRRDSEYVWYGFSAFKAGVRETWAAIVRRFQDPDADAGSASDEQVNRLIENAIKSMEAARQAEDARVAALPDAEREAVLAQRRVEREAWEAEKRRRTEHPTFGDFLIEDHHVRDSRLPGAWVLRDRAPGVIQIPEHLSMCLADGVDVSTSVLDALAELSAIRSVMQACGISWKPGGRGGPQYVEWPELVRLHQTFTDIAAKAGEKALPDTLAKAFERVDNPLKPGEFLPINWP